MTRETVSKKSKTVEIERAELDAIASLAESAARVLRELPQRENGREKNGEHGE